MSWTTSDIERWLRNSGKGSTIALGMVDGKMQACIVDVEMTTLPDAFVGRSSTLADAIENAMTDLRNGPVKVVGTTTYPQCPSCHRQPLRVYATGAAECFCGVRGWQLKLHKGLRVQTTGGVFEFDGTCWGSVVP